jgi:hypothetical protein
LIQFQLKKSGVHVITMGIGGWTDDEELMAIASYPYDGNRIDVKSYGDLVRFSQTIVDIFCNS